MLNFRLLEIAIIEIIYLVLTWLSRKKKKCPNVEMGPEKHLWCQTTGWNFENTQSLLSPLLVFKSAQQFRLLHRSTGKSDLGGKHKYGGDTCSQWEGGVRCQIMEGNSIICHLKEERSWPGVWTLPSSRN